MSFTFSAVGTKDEVVAQLGHADIQTSQDRFNEFGSGLRDLLMKHFYAETALAGPHHEYRYAVKASGHGGGNAPLSVQLTIEPHYVKAIPAETAKEQQDDE